MGDTARAFIPELSTEEGQVGSSGVTGGLKEEASDGFVPPSPAAAQGKLSAPGAAPSWLREPSAGCSPASSPFCFQLVSLCLKQALVITAKKPKLLCLSPHFLQGWTGMRVKRGWEEKDCPSPPRISSQSLGVGRSVCKGAVCQWQGKAFAEASGRIRSLWKWG